MRKTYAGHSARLHRQLGFTLVELMIVVAIIGILAGVAVPAYTKYVTKANRSAVQGYMLQIASREEQYLADARTYATLGTLGLTAPAEVDGKYTVVATVITDNAHADYIAGAALPQYVITATPIGSQLANDTTCGVLTLNSLGTKGSVGAVSECW